MTQQQFSLIPHADIELKFPRQPIEYFVTLPDKGIKQDTGLIMFIPGFGMLANDDYVANKLSPHLANQHNCVVVSVNYFGIYNRPNTNKGGGNIRLADDFSHSIQAVYGLSLTGGQDINQLHQQQTLEERDSYARRVLDGLSQALPMVKNLDPRCQVLLKTGRDEYQSFGLLPAIDHLQVLGEVIKQFKINRRRMIVYGTSYGGYVALLMGKFAPQTFSVVIDNSGFVCATMNYIVAKEFAGYSEDFRLSFDQMKVGILIDNPWTIVNETSPYFFADSHRQIRSLFNLSHWRKSTTRYFIFHSTQDNLSRATTSIEVIDKFVNLLKKHAQVDYTRVKSTDIDGKFFKNLSHGMNASLRGLFDRVVKTDKKHKLFKGTEENDFSLNSEYRLTCVDKIYVFNFKEDYTLTVSLNPIES